MKHDELRAVAHNLAASVAGCSFVVGIYDTDLSGALSLSPEGSATADFLRGTLEPPLPGTALAQAVALVPDALPAFCEKHGVSSAAFQQLTVRYWLAVDGPRFSVIVTDTNGHHSETDYAGWEGKRTKRRDELGRVRRVPIRGDS